jgi:hypothetical protein
MTLKNIVTAGDYKNGSLELKVKITKNNEVYLLKPGFFQGKFPIDKTTVESFEVLGEESNTSATSAVARGAIGALILGPVGIAAALSAKKKGVHTIAIQFKDGKRSMIDVDDQIYKTIRENLF